MKKPYLIILSLIIFFFSCDLFKKDTETTFDTTSPAIATAVVTTDQVTSTTLKLSWSQATDETTSSENLLYKVDQLSNNITETIINWTNNITYSNGFLSTEVNSLTHNTSYSFIVYVKDESENTTQYTTVTCNTPPNYVGTWVYSTEDVNNADNYLNKIYSLEKNSGTEFTTYSYNGVVTEAEFIMDISYDIDKLTMTRTQFRVPPATTFSDYTDSDATQIFDYRADENNLVLYIDDETTSNMGSVFTIDGYSGDDYNDGVSMLGKWGWGDTYADYGTTSATYYNTSTTPETVLFTSTYTFTNNILKLDIDGMDDTKVYIIDDIMVQDGGFGNTTYIYKSRD